MTESTNGHEIFEWHGQGYSPLVISQDWQVALLNWEPIFDPDKMGEIERHNESDEVFVLIKGKAVMFTKGRDGLQVSEMVPGQVFNVTKGSWHNLIASRDAVWVIVENKGTDLNDTELRILTDHERTEIIKSLPAWVKA